MNTMVDNVSQRFESVISSQEVDFSKKITLVALGNHILNTAGLAATTKGFGMTTLHSEGLAWVVSRMAIEMEQWPEQDETITIETWIEDYGRLTTTRNFRIYDAESRLLGCACTLWSIIDFETRKPFNLQNRPEWNAYANGEALAIDKPRRVAEIDEDQVAKDDVKYSDIDFNRHVNSMKYVEKMLDTYSLAQFMHNRIKRCDINYLQEAVYGDCPTILRKDMDRETIFNLKADDRSTYCRMALQWQPVE